MAEPTEARLRELRGAEGEALDELLCAWIDGELEAAEVAVLGERAQREPGVAQRRDALSGVDTALQAIALPTVPAGLRAKLQERIDRDAGAARSSSSLAPRTAATRAPKTVPRTVSTTDRAATAARRGRWLWPAATAALAAGLALYFAVGGDTSPLGADDRAPARVAEPSPSGSPPDRAPSPQAGGVDPARIAAADRGNESAPAPSPGAPIAGDPAPRELALDVAPSPGAPIAGDEADSGVGGTGHTRRLAATPDPALPADSTPAATTAAGTGTNAAALPLESEGIADAELAIALDMEALRDFDVIDQLELLERLAELDAGAGAGRAPAEERG